MIKPTGVKFSTKQFIQLGSVVQFIVHAQGDVDAVCAGKNVRHVDWRGDKALLKALAADEDIVVVDSYLAERACYEELVAQGATGAG